MFILTSSYFNNKVRAFDTKRELNEFINHRALKIANATTVDLETVLAAMVITENDDLNIGSKTIYPANELSNFNAHEFKIDNIKCRSMEGFLQSLKFDNISDQKNVCSLIGLKAKHAGESQNWKASQILYWQGRAYPRTSAAYQQLITHAYDELFKNKKFKRALKDTRDAVLKHSVGKAHKQETVLTTKEFIGQLNRLREK